MTEAEWLEYVHPNRMLEYLKRRRKDRKLRLLAAALCRRIGNLMTPERCGRLLSEAQRFGVFYGEFRPGSPDCLLRAIEDGEQCADELISVEALAPACELTDRLASVGGYYFDCYDPSWGATDHDLISTCEAAMAVHGATKVHIDLEFVATYASRAIYRFGGGAESNQGDPSEELVQCHLIRDLFPFTLRNLPKLKKRWRTDTTTAIARQMYDSRDFGPMPILADALQDAGCDNGDILAHCRSDGPHVRGCWAVDLVLGNE